MKKILFVCIENSCRSQMAEAFAKIHGKGRVAAYSAGSQPSGEVNQTAIKIMRELGYDLAAHRSKSIDDVPRIEFDYVISMGCGDQCPSVPARRREEWDVADPREMAIEEFRKIRDQIEAKVKSLVTATSFRSSPGPE